jgi:hypothetical protein
MGEQEARGPKWKDSRIQGFKVSRKKKEGIHRIGIPRKMQGEQEAWGAASREGESREGILEKRRRSI